MRKWNVTSVSYVMILFLVLACGVPFTAAQQEETNIVALLQAALDTAIKTFNSQNQPEAILQLNHIIDVCRENAATRALKDEERHILAQAYEYRGRAFYNIGETDKSKSDFEALIKIEPRYKLDSSMVSPKIVSLFDSIKVALVGNLAVFSKPSGAEVFINGKSLSLTPMYATELLKGEYLLEVRHKGFDVYSEKITIVPNTPLEKEVKLVPNTGTCIFYTSPPDVKILIDGEFVGTTFGQVPEEEASLAEQLGVAVHELSAPLKVEYIKPGAHRLELQKECYQTIVRSISVEIRTHAFEPFKLEPSRTSMQVTAQVPKASVFLGEAFQGFTPLTLKDVCTGSYRLRVKKEGIGQWFQQIELRKNEPQSFEAFMRPTLHFFGIINASERDPDVVSRVESKIAELLAKVKSLNVSTVNKAELGELNTQLELPVQAISSFAPAYKNLLPKKREQLISNAARILESDLLLFAYLPEEKLQRHVKLELFSAVHDQPDVINLAFNDVEQVRHFNKVMDSQLNLFQNWIGTITIETYAHSGLLVIAVSQGSSAEQVGIKPGDEIQKVNNVPVKTNREFKKKLAAAAVGSEIKLSFKQKGLIKAVAVKVGTSPHEIPQNSPDLFYNKVLADLMLREKLERRDEVKNFFRLNIGKCFMHFNNWQKAIEDAFSNTSLASKPGISSGTLNYYIGLCYHNLGYTQESKKFFQMAASQPQATLESNDGPTVKLMAEKMLAGSN